MATENIADVRARCQPDRVACRFLENQCLSTPIGQRVLHLWRLRKLQTLGRGASPAVRCPRGRSRPGKPTPLRHLDCQLAPADRQHLSMLMPCTIYTSFQLCNPPTFQKSPHRSHCACISSLKPVSHINVLLLNKVYHVSWHTA